MHSIKKNQIVVVALVIMIVIAGYLNYNSQIDKGKKVAGDISEQSQVAEGDEDSNFGEDALLPQDESGQSQTAEGEDSTQDQTAEGENSTPDQTAEGEQSQPVEDSDTAEVGGTAERPGEAVFVESDAVIPEYFAQAKVERENARAKSQDMLYELMANADTPEDKKSEAAQEIINLQKRIENEAAAEAMIKAKGFEDVFVRIYDDSVDVIVDKEQISQQEAAQIQDIVTRVTGVKAGNIRISLLKIGKE